MTQEMPFLDYLSFDELSFLTKKLTVLQRIGLDLEAAGMAPRFDLTPGCLMQIKLAAQMPEWLNDVKPTRRSPEEAPAAGDPGAQPSVTGPSAGPVGMDGQGGEAAAVLPDPGDADLITAA